MQQGSRGLGHGHGRERGEGVESDGEDTWMATVDLDAVCSRGNDVTQEGDADGMAAGAAPDNGDGDGHSDSFYANLDMEVVCSPCNAEEGDAVAGDGNSDGDDDPHSDGFYASLDMEVVCSPCNAEEGDAVAGDGNSDGDDDPHSDGFYASLDMEVVCSPCNAEEGDAQGATGVGEDEGEGVGDGEGDGDGDGFYADLDMDAVCSDAAMGNTGASITGQCDDESDDDDHMMFREVDLDAVCRNSVANEVVTPAPQSLDSRVGGNDRFFEDLDLDALCSPQEEAGASPNSVSVVPAHAGRPSSLESHPVATHNKPEQGRQMSAAAHDRGDAHVGACDVDSAAVDTPTVASAAVDTSHVSFAAVNTPNVGSAAVDPPNVDSAATSAAMTEEERDREIAFGLQRRFDEEDEYTQRMVGENRGQTHGTNYISLSCTQPLLRGIAVHVYWQVLACKREFL
jgi:hypothetical protein